METRKIFNIAAYGKIMEHSRTICSNSPSSIKFHMMVDGYVRMCNLTMEFSKWSSLPWKWQKTRKFSKFSKFYETLQKGDLAYNKCYLTLEISKWLPLPGNGQIAWQWGNGVTSAIARNGKSSYFFYSSTHFVHAISRNWIKGSSWNYVIMWSTKWNCAIGVWHSCQLPNERLFVGYANACSVSTIIQKITDLPAVIEFLRTGVWLSARTPVRCTHERTHSHRPSTQHPWVHRGQHGRARLPALRARDWRNHRTHITLDRAQSPQHVAAFGLSWTWPQLAACNQSQLGSQ